MKPFPYVGSFLYSLHVPSGFGGRYGSDMKTGHVFIQGLLAAILWVVDGLEMEGLCPKPGMSCGFLSAQSPLWPYWWHGQLVEQKVGSELAQFPLSVCFPLIPCSQHWHSSSREEKCDSNRIWQGVPSTGPGIGYGYSDRAGDLVCPWCTTCVGVSNGCLHLLRFYFVPYSTSLL